MKEKKKGKLKKYGSYLNDFLSHKQKLLLTTEINYANTHLSKLRID